MEKCIIVSDSFKGTLSSTEICTIATKTIKRMYPCCEVIAIPVADGGEGTVCCFQQALGAQPVTVTVQGPYQQPVEAVYARIGEKAIIEMAAAAGLPMVGDQRDPESTTTYGVGQMIAHAVEHGCTQILLGLGGSATNDIGCGCAAALGVKFYDAAGESFVPVGKTLEQIARIDRSEAQKRLEHVTITAMCDVDNPLCGEKGAAHIFAPQKGADEAMISRLEKGAQWVAGLCQTQLACSDLAQYPGAGAAGGMGAGCVAFLGGSLKSGIESILDMVEFDTLLKKADFVLTGEGRIDAQSVHGKVISGIAKRTQDKQAPLIALVGSIGEGAEECYDIGVTAMFGIDREAAAFEKFADKSALYYERTLEDILRLMKSVVR